MGGGSNITQAILQQEYQIHSIEDSNTYKILAREVNTVSAITIDGTYTPVQVNANSTIAAGGGASISAVYQISRGLNTGIGGNGWGAGTWGRLTWGSAATITTTSVLRKWTHDNFGEDLL